MKFVTDALLALRILSREGTGRILVPFALAMSAIAGLETKSIVVTVAILVGSFIWVGTSTRRSLFLQEEIAEERRLRSRRS
ncbi:MAG: hypothetical protein EOO77_45150 [Oxalobacteraceae bacterium]|nr:MAG: hypothetical protein EOO77_45150 [Oxalobacteraceae bacterium]